MKRMFLLVLMTIPVVSMYAGEEISQSQVPSLVINSFQKNFPKTYDVEWEREGSLYKVEFETRLFGSDHEAWYERSGRLIEHKQEIKPSDLPPQVLGKIRTHFNKYRVDDVHKLARGGSVTYKVELKTFREELKLTFDAKGNILTQVAD